MKMSKKAFVIVIDGCAHEYLEQGVTKNRETMNGVAKAH